MQILSYHDRRQQNSFMLDIIVSWTKPSYALELLGPDVNIAELSSNKIIDSESYELYRFFDLPTCSFNSFFILTFIRCLSSYKDFAFARTQSYWRWRSESKCNWWSLMLWDRAVNDLYR